MTIAPTPRQAEATVGRVFDAPRELVPIEEGVSDFCDRLAEHLARC